MTVDVIEALLRTHKHAGIITHRSKNRFCFFFINCKIKTLIVGTATNSSTRGSYNANFKQILERKHYSESTNARLITNLQDSITLKQKQH